MLFWRAVCQQDQRAHSHGEDPVYHAESNAYLTIY